MLHCEEQHGVPEEVRKAPIIVLAGHARVGKDTVAGMMAARLEATDGYDLKPHIGSFAKAVYMLADVGITYTLEVAAMQGLLTEKSRIYDTFDEWMNQHKEHVYRKFLQGTGQLFRELEGEDFWIGILERSLRNIPDNRPVIITDCRYLNEAFWANTSPDRYLVRVEGPIRDAVDLDHPSESEVDKIWETYPSSTIIHNDGSLINLTHWTGHCLDDIMQYHREACG